MVRETVIFYRLLMSVFMDITTKKNIEYWTSNLDEIWLEQMKMIHRGKDVNEAILQSFGHIICDEIRLNNTDISAFKRLVNTWLSNTKKNGHTKTSEHPAQAAARAFAERVGNQSGK